MSTHIECLNMIKQQLRTGEVLDEPILDLYQSVPRVDFVPDRSAPFAYSDMQIQLPHNQKMMTPLEEARMLQCLKLKGDETILEVGTGTGFTTALLSKMANHVITVDYYPEFTERAKEKLDKFNIHNVTLLTGDASNGWLESAPYDVIVMTGSVEAITETHRLQLLPGGKLFAIIGKDPIMQAQLHTLDHDDTWHAQLIYETNLPPLINKLKSKEFEF